jgi:hypothetical protein
MGSQKTSSTPTEKQTQKVLKGVAQDIADAMERKPRRQSTVRRGRVSESEAEAKSKKTPGSDRK